MTRRKVTADQSRARVELRLPEGLKARLESLAEESGVSLNLLMTGMLHGLVEHAHVGVPDSHGGFLFNAEGHPEESRMWFGYEAEPESEDPGEVWFEMDLIASRKRRPPFVVRPGDVK